MGKIAQDLDTFRMPVDLKIETEGNPEEKRVEVVGTSSEFSVDTLANPRCGDRPQQPCPTLQPQVRVAVAIRRGEQYAELSELAKLSAVPEGARDQPHQFAGPLPDRRSALSAKQLPAGGKRIPRSAGGDLDPK